MPETRFSRGTTVRVKATIKDFNDNLADPTTLPQCTIRDASGNIEVDGETCIKESTGIYYFLWQTLNTTDVGRYTAEIRAAFSGYTSEGVCGIKIVGVE